jgi:hypothetical protein
MVQEGFVMSAFTGFADLNDTLPDWLQIIDANGQPIAPDAAPTYKVYGPAGNELTAAAGTCSQVGAVTGLFLASILLADSSGFDVGERYFVVYSWAVSAAARAEGHTFGVT